MFELHPLHERFAAELRGLDLAEPLHSSQVMELRDAWNRYGVLVIRGQAISEQQLLAFARQFGTLGQFPPPAGGRPGGPELVRVSNVREDGSLADSSDPIRGYLALTRRWHKDGTYLPIPSFATLLRSVRAPTEGGETELVDLRVAFEELPRWEQERLAGLTAVHSYGHALHECGIEDSNPRSRLAAVHPLVAWHDDGRRSLYLSPLHMQRIEGMDEGDGAALLAELVQWSTEPGSIYRHVWQENDLMLWDNRTTMHRGMPYAERTEGRTMHRIVINGEGYAERLFAPPEPSLRRA